MTNHRTPQTNPFPPASDRHGAVTVEFAICCSVVFLLFFATLEMARFHVVRHTLDQASYEGARAGIIPGATAAHARAAAQAILSGGGIVNATVDVTPTTIDQTTTTVTVRVTTSFADNSWVTPKYFGGQSVIGETTLDHENVATGGGTATQ